MTDGDVRQHARALQAAAIEDAVEPTANGLAAVLSVARIVLDDGDAAIRDPAIRLDVSHELLGAILAYAHGRSAWREHYPLTAVMADPEGTLASLPVLTRESLPKRDSWRVRDVPRVEGSTGGVTAAAVRYPIWRDAIGEIEVWHHYRAVLIEHGLDPVQPMTIVREMPAGRARHCQWHPGRDEYTRSHGADCVTVIEHPYPCGGETATRCETLIAACQEHQCDVLVLNGSTMALFADWLRQGGTAMPACRLISATFESVDPRDAATLIESGFTGAVCDHMRCWDGGVTFLTCRFGRRHLLEHLGHAEMLDGRLVATDYFSLAAPFIRYWAGDHAQLGTKAIECECGRWSPAFEFAGRSSFLLEVDISHVVKCSSRGVQGGRGYLVELLPRVPVFSAFLLLPSWASVDFP